MSSAQQQIRNAIMDRLRSLPGVTVLQSPRLLLGADQLPAVCVYSLHDRPQDPQDNTTLRHPRIYTVRVEIRVQERSEEEATEALAAEVRKRLQADETLGGLLPDTALDGLALQIAWADQQWDGSEDDSPLSGTALDFDITYLWNPE